MPIAASRISFANAAVTGLPLASAALYLLTIACDSSGVNFAILNY